VGRSAATLQGTVRTPGLPNQTHHLPETGRGGGEVAWIPNRKRTLGRESNIAGIVIGWSAPLVTTKGGEVRADSTSASPPDFE